MKMHLNKYLLSIDGVVKKVTGVDVWGKTVVVMPLGVRVDVTYVVIWDVVITKIKTVSHDMK